MKYNPVSLTSVILIVAATACSTAPVPDDQPYGPYTNLQVLIQRHRLVRTGGSDAR